VIEVGARKETDQIVQEIPRGVTSVSVGSGSGIGGLDLKRECAAWPARIRIRLQLGGLESLRISGGSVSLAASVESRYGGRVIERRIDAQGYEHAIEKADPLCTEIRTGCAVATRSDGPGSAYPFEIILPPTLLRTNPESISVDRIDFYR
jgi:hypothetical protein